MRSFGCGVPDPFLDCVVTLQDRDVILLNADTPGLHRWNPQNGNDTAQQSDHAGVVAKVRLR